MDRTQKWIQLMGVLILGLLLLGTRYVSTEDDGEGIVYLVRDGKDDVRMVDHKSEIPGDYEEVQVDDPRTLQMLRDARKESESSGALWNDEDMLMALDREEKASEQPKQIKYIKFAVFMMIVGFFFVLVRRGRR
ncbi:MAG: hypothetical protein JW893_04690 [Candidatus Omnitrophica bacterium]|nr:hypothetical protein [Candidatus Omnitrophota bacterium]